MVKQREGVAGTRKGFEEFWSPLTESSWRALRRFTQRFDCVVISDWGVWLWTKALKSVDVEVIVSDFAVLERIHRELGLKKNEHLQKYEASLGGIDVDIYVPYWSRLTIPIELALKYATSLRGFKVLTPEALVVLKQGVAAARAGTPKGLKDALDILALLFYASVDLGKYFGLVKEAGRSELVDELVALIKAFDVSALHWLGSNPRQFKLWRSKTLEELRHLK